MSKYPDFIVGVKIGHYEGSLWTPFDNAIAAAARSNVPLFVECHLPQYSLEDQLNRMRPGDIITHSFEKISERMSVIDEQKNAAPFVEERHKKEYCSMLDMEGAGFWFSEAMPALQTRSRAQFLRHGLAPIEYDAGMEGYVKCHVKIFKHSGMTKRDIIVRATWAPANPSNVQTPLGNLSVGAVADVAVLSLRNGNFGFVDAGEIK